MPNSNIERQFQGCLSVAVDCELEELRRGFEGMKADAYCKGGYRFRAVSRFSNHGEDIELLPNVPCYQPLEINPLKGFGGIRREYPNINRDLVETASFKRLAKF
jgi:hypothetical protein